MKGISVFGTDHPIVLDFIFGLIGFITGIIMIIYRKQLDKYGASMQRIFWGDKDDDYTHPSTFEKVFSWFGPLLITLIGGFLIIKSILRYYGLY